MNQCDKSLPFLIKLPKNCTEFCDKLLTSWDIPNSATFPGTLARILARNLSAYLLLPSVLHVHIRTPVAHTVVFILTVLYLS